MENSNSIQDGKLKSSLEIINEVDNYYHFRIASSPITLGYVLPVVAGVIVGQPGWECDTNSMPRTLTLVACDEKSRTETVKKILATIREGRFLKLGPDHESGDVQSVFDANGDPVMVAEPAAISLLGLVAYRVSTVLYTTKHWNKLPSIWVYYDGQPRFQAVKSNRIVAHMPPAEALLKHGKDHIDLKKFITTKIPEEVLGASGCAKSAGTVTWFGIFDGDDEWEKGLLAPTIHYVYDVEVPRGKQFNTGGHNDCSWTEYNAEDVKTLLIEGQIENGTFGHGLVLLDFMVRHGIVNAENDPHFAHLIPRLHRQLEFPIGAFQKSRDETIAL
ncbi:hypothetical protein B0O99DRAFT_707325 [Bisporella sp. PMI_857]|nr:hypothetical protein B0O99DRAFT_707325 [Bisporella sp. PMI_857]